MKKTLGSGIVVAMLAMGACSGPTLDEKTSSLVDTLGLLCNHFDFQTKQDIGDGDVRPVHCSAVGSDREHPEFILYVFSDEGTQDEWIQLPIMKRAEQLNGNGWSIDTDNPELLDDIEGRLR